MAKPRLNKWQKEIVQLENSSTEKVTKELWRVYNRINRDIRKNLKNLINQYEELPEYQKINAMRLLSLEKQLTEIVKSHYSDKDIEKVREIVQGYSEEERDEGYFSTIYQIEMENGVELKMPVRLDQAYIRQSIATPVNPSLLSMALYQNRDKIAGRAGEALRLGLIQGHGYRDIALQISRWTESSYKNSLRIAITEGNRVRGQAKQKAQEDAVEMGARLEKMWLSALDTRVRSSHRKMDGQVVKVDEEFTNDNGNKTLSPGNFGIAKEDINCRCTVVSVVNGIKPSERRDGYGNVIPYQRYEDWYQERINKNLKVDQDIKITKKDKTNAFSVKRDIVNSKKFHDKFESFDLNKRPKERLYHLSKRALEHRDGTEYEDLFVLDYKTGNLIAKNIESTKKFSTGLSDEEYAKVKSHKGKMVLLHNHPEGGRLSFQDIKTAFETDGVEMSVVAGHDGSVHYIYDFNRNIDIELVYNKWYSEFKKLSGIDSYATKKATDKLYESEAFKYGEI